MTWPMSNDLAQRLEECMPGMGLEAAMVDAHGECRPSLCLCDRPWACYGGMCKDMAVIGEAKKFLMNKLT